MSPVAASVRLPPTTVPPATACRIGSPARSPACRLSAAAPTPNMCMVVTGTVPVGRDELVRIGTELFVVAGPMGGQAAQR